MDKRRVLLVGDSLVLAGLQASLGARSELEIVTLPALPALEALQACRAIIYDRTAPCPEGLLAAAQAEPGLLLIGVDPSSDGLLVTASREQRWLGMAGLVEIIGGKQRD